MSDAFERAARRQQRVGFWIHLAVYLAVNVMLFATWWMTSSGETMPWPLFSVFGWGIGVVAHAVAVFATGGSAPRRPV